MNNNQSNGNKDRTFYNQDIKNQTIIKKRKKKHPVLKFFFLSLLIGGAIHGVVKWQNNIATEYLNNILSDQPFEFRDNDYINYVTDDIVIPTEIKIEDEVISVDWESNKPDILNTDGKVKRPEKYNEAVTLTASIRHGIGKGEINYNLTVIKTETTTKEDVFILSEEEIEKGIGNNNLTLTYDENKNIESIDGSFGSTTVSSLEDALKIVDLYRNILKIDESIHFIGANVQSNKFGTVFTLQQVVENIPVWGKTIILTTNENGNLDSINVNVCRETKIDISHKLDKESLNKIVDKHFGYDVTIEDIEEGIFIKDKPFFAYRFKVYSNNENNWLLSQVVIDAKNEKVISLTNLIDSIGEMVDAEGKSEFGNTEKFKVRKIIGYELFDSNRNISIIDGEERLGDKIVSFTLDPTIVLLDKSLQGPVYREDNEWDIPQGVSSYIHLITTYDWYNDKFGWKSIDGEGKEIRCVVNSNTQTDNACFINKLDFFVTGPAKQFDYSPCAELDVMAHEYTHGVFSYVAGGFNEKTYMTQGISEGYADIFGCLIEGNWQMGERLSKYPLRDPSNESEKLFQDKKYPDTYLDENWSYKDGHINSVLLSRAAYKMTQNNFSSDDVANIWYQSMTYGYSDNSDFLDVRSNVEKAARKLGYTDEKVNKIGDIFAELGIGEKATKEVKNYSIEGDMFKDDKTKKDFLFICSPIGSIFGSPTMIFEEDTGLEQNYTDEEMSKILSEYFTDYVNSDNETDITVEMKIEYSRKSKWTMDLIKKFAGESRGNLIKQVSDETGQTTEDTGSWFNAVFLIENYNGTSYNFWTECLGIDFSEFSIEK